MSAFFGSAWLSVFQFQHATLEFEWSLWQSSGRSFATETSLFPAQACYRMETIHELDTTVLVQQCINRRPTRFGNVLAQRDGSSNAFVPDVSLCVPLKLWTVSLASLDDFGKYGSGDLPPNFDQSTRRVLASPPLFGLFSHIHHIRGMAFV